MKITNLIQLLIASSALLALTLTAEAQITVTVDRNIGADANKEFKFKNVRAPAKDDLGARAQLLLLVGEIDPASGQLDVLTDGLLPTKEDDPKSNFSFVAGSSGGSFRLDLGSVVEIRQINTYSWHPNTGAPQVYMLYASDGSTPNFCAEPKVDTNPLECGWRLLTSVDTRRKRGDGGGQYAVSLDARPSLGKYRYLLFNVSATETDDDAGNTFFSEIDVIARK